LNHPLYTLLLNQLTEKPDLAAVQNRHPLAEEWPVILTHIHTYRNQMQHFTISDGTHTLICTTNIPDVESRIKQMELGSIIHIIGADIRFSETHKQYTATIQQVCTLKEYDDRIKLQQEAQRMRMEWLKQQHALEEALTGAAGVLEPVLA